MFQAFSLGTCFDVIQTICENFNKRKKTLVMNMGASFLSAEFPKEFMYIFDKADIIFGNEYVSNDVSNYIHLPCIISSL